MTVKKQLEAIEDAGIRRSSICNMPMACADMQASNVNTAAMICLLHALSNTTKQFWYNFINPFDNENQTT